MGRIRCLALTGTLVAAAGSAGAGERLAWLWDKAEAPPWSGAEVAPIERHILLSGDDILVRKGRHFAFDPHTRITPVLHVEVSTIHPPTNIEASRAPIIEAMRLAAAHSTSGRVQLDMEAKPSQREFYRSLVRDLRAALPTDVALSVTALAWWCRSPAWLDKLAADEVVPMFFRMGKDGPALRELIEHAPQTLHPSCRSGSAGFSPQEPFPDNVSARYHRSYWFDYHAWKRVPTKENR